MNKILIVDDSEINRELLSDILSDEYEVLEAENGLSATDLINREKDEISAILLDSSETKIIAEVFSFFNPSTESLVTLSPNAFLNTSSISLLAFF